MCTTSSCRNPRSSENPTCKMSSSSGWSFLNSFPRMCLTDQIPNENKTTQKACPLYSERLLYNSRLFYTPRTRHDSQPSLVRRQALKGPPPYLRPFPHQQGNPPVRKNRKNRSHPKTPARSNFTYPRRHEKRKRQTKRQPIHPHDSSGL